MSDQIRGSSLATIPSYLRPQASRKRRTPRGYVPNVTEQEHRFIDTRPTSSGPTTGRGPTHRRTTVLCPRQQESILRGPGCGGHDQTTRKPRIVFDAPRTRGASKRRRAASTSTARPAISATRLMQTYTPMKRPAQTQNTNPSNLLGRNASLKGSSTILFTFAAARPTIELRGCGQ